MRSSKLLVSLATCLALAIGTTAQAVPMRDQSNSGQSTMNCWGLVSSQLAQVEGGIGEHTSSQATPRLGLGNVARLFYDMGLIAEPTLSDLGSFLAQLDEHDETVCPIQ